MASVIELVLRAHADPAALRQAREQIRESIAGAVQEAGRRLEQALTSPMQQLAGRMRSIGDQLSAALTLPIAGLGVAASRAFLGLDRTIAQIAVLTGTSRDEVEKLTGALRDLAHETGRGPQELAEALYFVLSSGIQASQAMDVLAASARAASLGLGATQTVADAVTTAMNAYGQANLNAADATAILLAGVREGKAEADALAGAIGRVVPVAAQMGVSFDQLVAALAAMTRSGLSADEAVTALRAVLTDVLQPSREAEQVLQAVGLSSAQLRQQLREQGLLSVLETLRERFANNAEALSGVFDNVRGLVGVLNLLGLNGKEVERIFRELAGTTRDDLDKAFEEAQKQVSLQFQRALVDLQVFVLDLGQRLAPALQMAAGALRAFADAFSRLPGPVQGAILAFIGVGAALGPILSLFGRFAQLLGMLRGAWQAMIGLLGGAAVRGAITALFGLFARLAPAIGMVLQRVVGLAGPIGLVASGVTLLAQAWSQNWLGMQTFIRRVAPGIVQAIDWIGDRLRELGERLGIIRRAQEQMGARPGQAPAVPAPQLPVLRPPGGDDWLARLREQENARAEAEQRIAQIVQRAQAEIQEALGRTHTARLLQIRMQEQEIARQTGNEVLAHRWAQAQIQALHEETARRLRELTVGTVEDLTRVTGDSAGAQVLAAAQAYQRQKDALDQALRAEMISRQDHAGWVLTLQRQLELQIGQIFAEGLAQRRQALEQFAQQYSSTIMGLANTEAEIARLTAERAGATRAQALQTEADKLEQLVGTEGLTARDRAQLAQQLVRAREQVIQALRAEGAEIWKLQGAESALQRARDQAISALSRLADEQRRQASQLQESMARVRGEMEAMDQRAREFMQVVRGGADDLAAQLARKLVVEIPSRFLEAWQHVWAQLRADAASTADHIARVMDPRTRRSPSLVDRVREGLAEIEAAWQQTARRLGALGPGPQPGRTAAPGVQLIINGQQIQVGAREAADLVRLLVQDPIQRARLARAMGVAW